MTAESVTAGEMNARGWIWCCIAFVVEEKKDKFEKRGKFLCSGNGAKSGGKREAPETLQL